MTRQILLSMAREAQAGAVLILRNVMQLTSWKMMEIND